VGVAESITIQLGLEKLWAKVSGNWVTVKAWYKDGGTWKSTKVWVKVGGSWEKVRD